MKIQGEHSFAAPRQEVWDAVLDPEMIARTLPGCERLEEIGEGQYRGLMQIQVGPVQGQFEGTVTLSQLVPPESYHLDLKGKGAPGFVNGKGQIRLEAARRARPGTW